MACSLSVSKSSDWLILLLLSSGGLLISSNAICFLRVPDMAQKRRLPADKPGYARGDTEKRETRPRRLPLAARQQASCAGPMGLTRVPAATDSSSVVPRRKHKEFSSR